MSDFLDWAKSFAQGVAFFVALIAAAIVVGWVGIWMLRFAAQALPWP